MNLNFTLNPPYRKFSYLIFIVLCPFVAQSQNTNAELEQRMQALYDRATQLYANLPNRDFRGNYLTFSFGISPFGHIQKWSTEEVCDCEGNHIETRLAASPKAPISLGVGMERRISNAFSLRFMGNYASLSHGKGKNVMAGNGTYAHLQQDYTLSQYGLHGSVLLHIKNFYGGIGASYTSTRASGFKTDAEKPATTPPLHGSPFGQYFDLKAQVLRPFQTDYAPHLFIGYRQIFSPLVSGSCELGVAQSFYVNLQLHFTLLGSTRVSLTNWLSEHEYYKSVRREAIKLDMKLHPAKFQTSNCTVLDNSSSSNRCR